MADGGRVGKFSQNIIGDQRLPLHVVLDECLEMSLQEISGDRHLGLILVRQKGDHRRYFFRTCNALHDVVPFD
jgi:hypothetical protein